MTMYPPSCQVIKGHSSIEGETYKGQMFAGESTRLSWDVRIFEVTLFTRFKGVKIGNIIGPRDSRDVRRESYVSESMLPIKSSYYKLSGVKKLRTTLYHSTTPWGTPSEELTKP